MYDSQKEVEVLYVFDKAEDVDREKLNAQLKMFEQKYTVDL